MVTEERLMLGNITGITHSPKQEQWRESRYDLYIRFLYEVRGYVFARLDIPSPREETPLQTIINELESLRSRTNIIYGYVFKPTKHAIHSAKFYIYETYAKMMSTFPRPFFVLDGLGGIIIKWTLNGYSVRLNCMEELGEQDYIYFENGEYDIEDNVTPDLLQRRLNWLIHHEREPAR